MTVLRQRATRQDPDVRWVGARGADGAKMSDVLEEFVAPYEHSLTTTKAYRTLLSFGTMAWNLALFPEDKQPEELGLLLAEMPADMRAEGKDLICSLIARKKQQFPECRRMIIDFELTETASGRHLAVASSAEPV